MITVAKHPAPFSMPILGEIDILARRYNLTGEDKRILDPFAGVGWIHTLRMQYKCQTFGIEIEPDWAAANPYTIVGDATKLPFPSRTFHAVATSPTYANRMADSHNAQDGSYRRSYTHTLGHTLHPNNTGKMQWGRAYRESHIEAWAEVKRVLRPSGKFILNISNHVRDFEEMPVMEWHLKVLLDMRFFLREMVRVETKRHRRGENHESRTEYEYLLVLEKPM